MPQLKTAGDLEQLRKKLLVRESADVIRLTVCSGTGCLACDSKGVAQAFADEIEKQGLGGRVTLRRTGCYGFCERGPVVVVHPKGICYLGMRPADVPEVVRETLKNDKVVERLVYKHQDTGKPATVMQEIPFYKHQKRMLLERNALLDPKNIEDYLAIGGYSALAKALGGMKPEDVVKVVKESGLRGRGGGGYPTGRKWESTRNAAGNPKYVIVNADEGDPGAYMDRSLLEGNPHSILEGLAIGGFAIGANEGFVYVRQEYPLAIENTRKAIAQAEEYGLLGRNILGSGFDFSVKIHEGAGAFVSGESSALVNAIEGRVGEPRPKYVHLSDKGLWNKPTCLNNVETWANVPLIIDKGAAWFKSMGTKNSTGTKIFSLVGHVNNTGLVEVPMGMTLRDIVFKIGGGVPKGRRLKAVQTGGPSGGVIPENLLDLPVDFDELTKAGSMMGSGGMIVMDEKTCMVDTARYYVDFLAHESCGKCVPCREGLRQMLRILNDIAAGNGSEGDLQLLEELSSFMSKASLCALGATASNPVLSTIKHFRAEYESHIRDRKCPAGVCKGLICYDIERDKCLACGACAKQCPANAISKGDGDFFVIDREKCVKCGICITVCPEKASAIRKVAAFA